MHIKINNYNLIKYLKNCKEGYPWPRPLFNKTSLRKYA